MPNIYKIVVTIPKVSILAIFFGLGCLSITFTQLLTNLFIFDIDNYRLLHDFNKRNFVVLVAFVTYLFSSSTTLSLSFANEELERRSIFSSGENKGKLILPSKALVIANHQIYSDWFYLWFLAYLSQKADSIYIVMKKSLRKIPIIGYGMENYNFVFLSRNWANDKKYMSGQFAKMSEIGEKVGKLWMLIFPEGTNINHVHLAKSQAWSEKMGLPKLETVLLPRVKGLYVAAKELRGVTDTILDFTIGYSPNNGKEEMAQDVWTLGKIYGEGESPSKINVLINEYHLKEEIKNLNWEADSSEDDIEMEKLDKWICKVFELKEKEMQHFYQHGNFGRKTVEIPLKLRNQFEILNVFIVPLVLTALCLLFANIFRCF